MDKFDEILSKWAAMTSTEVASTIEGLKKKCDCAICPTYNECATTRHELLFCAIGKSKSCITSDEGCSCATCPVTAALDLSHYYYCLRGSETEMRMK
ncbi:MAG: DUF2769 domain-containing protein [Methanomassiliicoccales archaeon]